MTRLISPIIILMTLILSLFLIYEINYISRDSYVLAGNLFLTQATLVESLKVFLFFIILLIAIRGLVDKYTHLFINNNDSRIFIILILISIIMKLFLIDYNNDYNDIQIDLSKIFDQGMFNQYKTYSYLALFISQVSDNPAKILNIINSIMSSLTIGIVYLILKKIKLPSSMIALSMILLLSYIPFQANDILLRVDVLFMFLFTLSIFLSFDIIHNYTFRKLLLLNLLILVICFTRESMLYLLPIFILILLACKKKRYLSILTLSMTVILSSIVTNMSNMHNYGMTSYVKNFHLIIKLQNYGYLNQNILDRYAEGLSIEASSLLEDIKKSYDINILPHKRESFVEENFAVLQNNPANTFLREKILYLFQVVKYHGLGYLIRPDRENIYMKNSITQHTGDLDKIRNNYFSDLENHDNPLTTAKLNNIMKMSEKKLTTIQDKDLANYMRAFILQKSSDCTSKKVLDNDVGNILNKECIANKIIEFDQSFMIQRSDNWTYKEVAIPFTWRFDKEKRKYMTHPHINKVEEILLSMPALYIMQSLITLTSMTGYVPVPSGIATEGNFYSDTIYPDLFLITFQKGYQPIMNFWYVLCLMVFVIYGWKSILERKVRSEVIIAIIPLYYGLFIAFASPFEFNRLIMPVVPYIIISFSIILYNISNIVFKSSREGGK